ncbi:uncharacterized protein LOC111258760 isoform X1 [Varroa jacobsoni]|uniref:uncharacterized protein LOC111258760 isoform X1 n=2 Tax=Varroa jacobsoni TaxID=62625 RepID=UPI000BF876BA|nr:uncharacterized protein LOC111258760 isoform X1 [Varroa jacobsoni]XP_022686000.1 uncharacterized protein LOC111258760 isoform X1 [Varroa jacobsoni]XP_022686001.1 uncharacterized protein LOC111258760 isoform X1 [Varroa jacobsoni]XP_022686002.1 uncharacterized protein LOC111258760 isoform X1 [Varroa jacobsoni]
MQRRNIIRSRNKAPNGAHSNGSRNSYDKGAADTSPNLKLRCSSQDNFHQNASADVNANLHARSSRVTSSHQGNRRNDVFHSPVRVVQKFSSIGQFSKCFQSNFEKSNKRGKTPSPAKETFNIPLWKRLFVQCDEKEVDTITQLERDIENEPPDMLVISRSGTRHPINKKVLAKMCGYFEAICRSGMRELKVNEVMLEIEDELLTSVFKYAYSGEVTLNENNAIQIYKVAHYLQMDSLVDVCSYFIGQRIRQFSKDLYDLGLKFGCEYFTLAVVDAICRSPEILEDESLLSQMNIDMFQDVFSNDNLLVESEDKACDLVLQWVRAADRSKADIRCAVECLRLPHITPMAERKLKEMLSSYEVEVPLFTTCVKRNFTDLPEKQLAFRASCPSHVHIFWKDEMGSADGPVNFHMTCMRFRNYVLSNYIIDASQHRIYSENYEFLVVGNQIVKITQNKEETELKVESLEIMGRLTYRTVFKREAPLSDFTACSDGSRCVISYFNGFGRPPKFNACDTTDWKQIEDYYEVPSEKLRFSPREMSFFEDVVFIMRNQTMFISDRHDNSLTELEIPEKLGHNKLVSFIHVNNKIYVYEDRSSGVIQKLFNDRLHVVNLETREIEDTILIDFRVKDRDIQRVSGHRPGRVRKFFRFENRIYIVIQEDGIGNAFFIRFDPGKNTFGPAQSIRTFDFINGPSNRIFSRKFLMQVPTYFRYCRHESILQAHLRTIKGRNRELEMALLKKYV